ncbi:MAG: hypothetical protein KC619_05765 [Myxococcales bacterium]|nr:hypothetical protein [Myxococcales bacterium]
MASRDDASAFGDGGPRDPGSAACDPTPPGWAVRSLPWLLALLTLLAPMMTAAQSDLDVERIARGELDMGNATLGNWHYQLHVEADALQPRVPGLDLAGPAATLMLAGLVGLTGGITTLVSIEEAPAAIHQTGLVILGIAGGLLVFGIGWLIERFVSRNSTDAGQRYRSLGRALDRVHRAMRHRRMPVDR